MRESGFGACLIICAVVKIGLRLRDVDFEKCRGGVIVADAWFAESFLCGVQQRRDVVLGRQLLRTSDAFRCLLASLYFNGVVALCGGRRVSG